MKKVGLILCVLSVAAVILTAWDGAPNSKSNIPEIAIGNQIWMAQNLDVVTFRNGDSIPEVKSKKEWVNATTPAWCYYNNDPANGIKYGKLYNWRAVTDSRGLAPEGWHIPASSEWSQLIYFLGGEKVAGKKLKSTDGWDKNGNGTNTSGFSALPGGMRNHDMIMVNDGFKYIGTLGTWWSTTVNWEKDKYGFALVARKDKSSYIWIMGNEGLPIRCVKD